jgi:hypothetical protein
MMRTVRRALGHARLVAKAALDQPALWRQKWFSAGQEYADRWAATPPTPNPTPAPAPNPLEAFFEARHQGPGIWKWRHYFDAYHRHLAPLRHRENLVVLEIGIYSGGSLDMWRDYFGPTLQLIGVDIAPACKSYERPGIKVLIGDQADRAFWRRAIADGTIPPVDVVIDDGGHTDEQQRNTLEELLPHLKPGGVYLCEDVHGADSSFSAYVAGLAQALHGGGRMQSNEGEPERRLVVPASGWQAAVHSVHVYPFVVAVEKRAAAVPELIASKHGTQWQPHLT